MEDVSQSGSEEAELESVPSPKPTVVGIGASAGGLAALKGFFDQVPPDSGLVFVVVVHLAPDHKSHLADLLQPHVAFPVQQVTETVPLSSNQVYVIPPNANLEAIDTHLRLSKLEENRRQRAPIDHFFRTLAATHDGSAIAVILTGTGSDGTLGIREIKAKGGLVIVQDPNDAEYDGMPQSAIATGLVDLVLPIPEIPLAILRYERTHPRLPEPRETEEDGDLTDPAVIQKILSHVRAQTDRDFSRYKPNTILRRIARRMQLSHVEDLPTYLERLSHQPDELRALADDFLITVTNFFRDQEVFDKLEQDILPRLFENKGPGDTVRAWSVGCSTGEEAYSLAMLLAEQAAQRKAPPQIQIFASDLHRRSLDKAREGFFPGDIETDLHPRRLKRFFQKENGGFRIQKEIRDLVVFAPHNLLGDPPFSRLDLISCRNLLMYLQRRVQREVIELFHYALNPEGVLLLGSAETLDTADLFRTEDKRHCLYRKRNVPAPEPRLPVFPLNRPQVRSKPPERSETLLDPDAYGSVHQKMLERYAPPSILISPDHKIVHLSENAGRYLVHPGGELTSSIFKLLREELRMELRSALQSAREQRQPTDCKPIPVRFNGHSRPVLMHVRPSLSADQDGYVLVIFDEREPQPQVDPQNADGPEDRLRETHRIQELEADLNLSQQRMQAIIEQYETGQEEMKASNEEMQSTNEELRSTLEELETSKEELQSINEELQTVNQENRTKVEELAQLSGDLQNLLAATGIATLFLDRELRILRFTPKLGELFNIRVTDRGRPISDLTHRLGYPELRADAGAVLDRLTPVEREVRDEAGRWYLTRVLPYRSTDERGDRIEGVVLTFIDISTRKYAEEALRSNEERLRRMINVDVVCVTIFDSSGVLVDCNDSFLSLSGYTREEVKARHLTRRMLTAREYLEATDQELRKLDEMGRIGPYEKEVLRKDGSRCWMLIAGATLGDNTIVEYSIDITDRKRVENELRESKAYAESIIETLSEPLLVLTPDLIVRSANRAFSSLFALEPVKVIGRKIFDLGNRQWDFPGLRELLERVLPENFSFSDFEVEQDFEGIGRRVVLLNARRLHPVQLILLGIRDITSRKLTEESLRESEQRYRLLIENTSEYAIFMLDAQGRIVTWNSGAQTLFGYRPEDIIGKPGSLIFTEEDQTAGVPEKEIETAKNEGRSVEERWHVRQDGSRFWASGVMELIRASRPARASFVKVLRDQTERKTFEESLTRVNDDLRHFAFAASHDLREPLRMVTAYAQMIDKHLREGPREKVEKSIQYVREGASRMERLLADLLTFTQVTLNTTEPEELVDLNQALSSALANLGMPIEQNGAQVTHETLPMVRGRVSHFVQLFQNLIENAVKYHDENPPRIHVSAQPDGRMWRFAVADNGAGIQPADREQIFEVFKRLPHLDIPGTGLGLAICRRIVERCGGHIWAEANSPGGSIFYFTVPMLESAPD